MNWWLFIQIFVLLVLIGLIVSATIESAMRELYKCRDQNLKNERHNWYHVPETHLIKGSSES